jgi:hypothetical protein
MKYPLLEIDVDVSIDYGVDNPTSWEHKRHGASV